MNFINIIIALAIIFLITGYSDSDLKKENTVLQLKLNNLKKYNAQLEMKVRRLNALKKEISNIKKDNAQLDMKVRRLNTLEKEISNIKKDNKDLSVTLAKSELVFSKKYKEELKKEEQRLKDNITKIENNARILSEKNAKNKYMIIIGSLIVFFVAFIGFTFFKKNEYNKKILEKEKNINQLNESIDKLTISIKQKNKDIGSLEVTIKEMEIKAKESSINQVVRKINENELHRNKSLKRIEKELTNG